MQVFPMAFGAHSTPACQACGCAETSCENCQTVANCSNCASCCCSTIHQSWRHGRIGNGIRIEYFSSAWMTIEVLGSIGVGLIAWSFALLAGLRRDSSRSGCPRTDNNRTEQFTSALLFALIPVIGLGAVYSYLSGLKPEGSPLGIAIAVGAVIVMPYLYVQKKRIGRETRSLALSMDAIESVTCLFMATALLGGLLAEYFLGFWWADYLATGVILGFVAREAVGSYRELHEEESVAHA